MITGRNNKVDIGITAPVPKGEWGAWAVYDKLNIVHHQSASYMAKGANSNVEPGVTVGWSDYWMLLCQDGENGTPGAVGPVGPEGPQGIPGKDGENGKSAYEYAQEGGYTGTEQQFYTELAGIGSNTHHYGARWDKINAKMVRMWDAASIPDDTSNFGHFGSVNADYSNPFDDIYPWSGIRLCNVDIDVYQSLSAGDRVTKCVKAWEGDPDFSYDDADGVWRYRPEFWGNSWDDGTYRYFDVTDKAIGGYVYYPEAIVGRWHGRAVTRTVGGQEKTCLIPSVGMPAKRSRIVSLHNVYAKNYGATIDSIFSIDADILLCIVEYTTMNTQAAIGNGVSNVYRQSSDLIAEDVTNSNVVKVIKSAASEYCIPNAIFDIGTANGGAQVGSYYIVSVQDSGDGTHLDVTLNESVTVTTANYWSVHGIINIADGEIGSRSGYIGTNGKCNTYYRGIVLFGNMYFYTLGAYENYTDKHIWLANSDEDAYNYDIPNTEAYYDTGIVLPTTASGYINSLAMLDRSGLLSAPPFVTAIGGSSTAPVGDSLFSGNYTDYTYMNRGGNASNGAGAGAFYATWNYTSTDGTWGSSARPRLKNPK